jgi:hypothetical protein
MSKDFGINSTVNGSAWEGVSTRGEANTCTSLIDTHASELIDDLFQDLNKELEGAAPSSTVASASHRTVSASTSLATLLPKPHELEDSLLVPFVELGALLEPLPNNTVVQPESVASARQHVLLGVTCAAFVGSVGLWGFTQFLRPAPQPVVVQVVPQPLAQANPADVAFAAELGESLQVAEQMPVVPPAIAAVPPTVTVPQTVSAVVPPTLPTQPVQGIKTTVPPKPSGVARQVLPRKVTKASPAPPTIAMATLSSRLPQLTPNQAPQATLNMPSAAPQALAPQALPVGTQGKVGVMVQGILDLGDKSAMLISRNGSTQNVRLGEALDSTGWTFVRVEQGQAVIQRGNVVRSVGSGEQF